jgi:hypothetical protein
MSGTRRLPRGRIAKRGPIRTRSSPSDSAEGGDENRRPERVRGKGDSGGAPKVGKKRFFAGRKNSAASTVQGSRRRTPGVGARLGASCGFLVRRAGAGRRGKENRKTGKNGGFRRRFEKTRCNTGRNDVRRTRPEATNAWARSASIGARRAKSEGRKTKGKSLKPDDSGATFGTVGGPVAVDAERRNSAVGRGDASAAMPENFVPIGRAVRTPGTSARDHPPSAARGDGNANRRGAGGALTRETRGSLARDASSAKPNEIKIAKIGEGVRKLSTIRRASETGFVRRRPHAGDDGRAQRHRTAVVAAEASLAQWAERRTVEPEVAGSIPRTDFFLQSRCATKAKSRKRIDNHSQPLPSVDSSTVHETKYTPCGHIPESSIATRGGHCTTTTKTSRKIKPEIASSAV